MTRPERVVGVGSSAGGLEALAEMLRSLPTDLPVAYVVAQHLAPTHESPLADILSRDTGLAVRVATDGAPLESGTILVVPPDADVEVNDTTISIVPSGTGPGPSPDIDSALRSLAQSWGENAVGIVLSGTGHDGSDGLRAVRMAGGLTIVQEPDTAKFGGMPASARATGAADLIIAPAQIGAALQRIPITTAITLDNHDDEGVVDAILLRVRSVTGADFTEYKRSTVMRQVARRMSLCDLSELVDYHELISRDPSEAAALSRLMLVTVTSFFRDPDVWDALEVLVRDAVEALGPDQQLRVWVPGCATGEEAYSLAIVCATAFGAPADLARRLKVFATDLNSDSLDIARRAVYADDAVQSIPAVMRERWLHRSGNTWEVVPALRDITVFARHNVAFDPPFPRIDVISMRNILIYFQPSLQERVLRMCHFALAPDGLLVLGDSERVAAADPLFKAAATTTKIYRPRAIPTPHPLPVPRQQTTPSIPSTPSTSQPERADRVALRNALIRRFTPPSLVTDDRDEVIEVIGDVSPWCWVADGQHNSNVVALLRDEFKTVVRSLLVQLRHVGVSQAEREVTTPAGRVRVVMRRLDPEAIAPAIVSFIAADTPPTDSNENAVPAHSTPTVDVDEIHRELDATREALQSTIEELAASNEELQVMNEELQASAEELQVSGEEVQASNEELEATNEELRTLNQELQIRAVELTIANADLQTIEDSITSGLVLVDRELQVTRFTPLAVRLFALIDQDVGRPLAAIPTRVPMPDLETELRAAVVDGAVSLREVSSETGDFLVQIQPYAGPRTERHGAVIVITDIAELSATRRALARRLEQYEALTETMSEVVWQRDHTGRLEFINERVESVFGLRRERVMADPTILVAAIHPEDRDRVQTAAAAAHGDWQIEYRVVHPDGDVRWIQESGSTVTLGDDLPFIVGTARDVTDGHARAAAARAKADLLQAVMDNGSFGVVFLDQRGGISEANDVFARLTGYPAESLVDMALGALLSDADDRDAESGMPLDEDHPSTVGQRMHLTDRGGATHVVRVRRHPMRLTPDSADAEMVIIQDVTDLETAGSQLVARARYDQHTGLALRSYFSSRADAELQRVQRTGGRAAILWVDLDGFKEVNDYYGHQAGDQALSIIAARLRTSVRSEDVVGRLGGDEFAVLVVDASDRDGLEILADRILAEIREPIVTAHGVVHLSSSIGIAESPEDGLDAEALLHNADTAMYEAKKRGRDRHVYFRAAMNQIAEERAQLRHRLSAAIRARAFVVHYQPIIDSATGTIRMAEALVRLSDDLAPAAEFIDVAEQTGQLRMLGRVMFELLDQDLRALHADHGSELPISVNLSASQLADRETADWLLSWQPPGGLQRITFEITESIDLTTDSRAFDLLLLLRRLGATISIDDFGTGYSNLSLLDRLRPDSIKIDRSLLQAATEDAHALEVFSAAVQIARALADSVVVEGVETSDEHSLVTDMSIELLQGYWIARPMPLHELAAWPAATD